MKTSIAGVGTVLVVMMIVGVARGGKLGDFLFGALLGSIVASAVVHAATKADTSGQSNISAAPPAAVPAAILEVAPPTAVSVAIPEVAPPAAVSVAIPDAVQPATLPVSTAPQSAVVYCATCGFSNPTWRWECEKCHAQLARPAQPATALPHDRPGCLTAYAILLGIASGFIGLGGLAVGVVQVGQPGNAGAGLVTMTIAVTVGVLYGLLTRGIWRMRNWARVVVIVLQGIACAINVLSACASLSTSSSTASGPVLLAAFAGLAISGVIIYWFASHGEYFD